MSSGNPKLVVFADRLASSAAAAVNGDPVRINGAEFNVQTIGPSALIVIQISNDKISWTTARSKVQSAAAGVHNSLTGLQNALVEVLERPVWARIQIAVDAGAPQEFSAIGLVFKTDD